MKRLYGGSVAFRLVPIAVSLILYLAAIFKLLSLSTVPADVLALSSSHVLYLAASIIEILLASLLCSGVWPHASKLAALVMFVSFSAYHIFHLASGFVSCNCFGIETASWIVLLLDMVVAISLALLLCFPDLDNLQKQRYSPGRIFSFALTIGAVSIFLATSNWKPVSDFYPENQGSARANQYFVIDAQDWVNGPFPLLEFVEPVMNRRLGMHKEYIALIVRPDCDKCEQLIKKVDSSGAAQSVVVFILLSRNERLDSSDGQFSEFASVVDIKSDIRFVGRTPAAMRIVNSRVVEVCDPESLVGG